MLNWMISKEQMHLLKGKVSAHVWCWTSSFHKTTFWQRQCYVGKLHSEWTNGKKFKFHSLRALVKECLVSASKWTIDITRDIEKPLKDTSRYIQFFLSCLWLKTRQYWNESLCQKLLFSLIKGRNWSLCNSKDLIRQVEHSFRISKVSGHEKW